METIVLSPCGARAFRCCAYVSKLVGEKSAETGRDLRCTCALYPWKWIQQALSLFRDSIFPCSRSCRSARCTVHFLVTVFPSPLLLPFLFLSLYARISLLTGNGGITSVCSVDAEDPRGHSYRKRWRTKQRTNFSAHPSSRRAASFVIIRRN